MIKIKLFYFKIFVTTNSNLMNRSQLGQVHQIGGTEEDRFSIADVQDLDLYLQCVVMETVTVVHCYFYRVVVFCFSETRLSKHF